MDYTWGLPVGSNMPSAWPYYQPPQSIPGYNPYQMSHPWTPGYMPNLPMYPYGGYHPEMGGPMLQEHLKNQVDVKPFHEDVNTDEEVLHSPNPKRRRLEEAVSEPINFVDMGLPEHQVYPDKAHSPDLDGLANSKNSNSNTTHNPSPVPEEFVPVPEEFVNSNDSSQLSPHLDSSVYNTGNNFEENSTDSGYNSFNQSHNGNENTFDHSHMHQFQRFNQSFNSESYHQDSQRACSPIESDTGINSFGNQLQESLMVVLPDGSKTALNDLQLPTAPFSNYQPPQQGTFIFSAPAVSSSFKAPRQRRSSGSTSRGSGKNYCHLCDKTYESKYKLKLHMYAHTGERPFVCEVCGKGFSRGPNLNAHMRVHTGAKPFSCTRCTRGFSHPSDRIIHMVTEVCLRADRILRKVSEGWECTACDSGVMENKDHAERHARQHEAGRGLFCPVCRTSYQGQKAHVLVKHVRENHPEYLIACGV